VPWGLGCHAEREVGTLHDVTRLRFRLRGTLLLGTLIPLLIVAAVAIAVTQALTSSLADNDAAARSEQILFTADLVTQDVIDAEDGMRGFVITGQESFLAPYERAASAFPTDIAAFQALVADDPQQTALAQVVGETFRDWDRTAAVPVIASVRAGATDQATALVASGAGKLRTDQIRVALNTLKATERDRAEAVLAATRGSTLTVRRIAFWGTLAAIVLAIVLAVVFARRISRRVTAVSTGAAALASGDLAERVPVTGHDEVADLATAFNEMASRLEAAAAAEQIASEELRRRTTETENANRELEAFSYSVSHDLRAPLRAMDGFSQALAEDYAPRLDDVARDYIGRVRAASQRMAALIDDLLRLSRLTRDTIRHEPVDLSAMAADVVAELRATEPNRRVDVTIEPGMDAVADVRLVRIALENLIGNAWKFTRERPDARIQVHEEAGPDGPEFVVADNGAGFDMRYAANLFGPFQRMHPVDRFGGTGIGLATVQRIVHRHGGTIRADSEVDRGTRFMFTLGNAGAVGVNGSVNAAGEGASVGI
jgi:signal transduction histidine kinase